MIDIDEHGAYFGLWYLAGDGRDWMAALYKRPKDAPGFLITYRLRTYAEPVHAGTDPFDGLDHKEWSDEALAPEQTEADAIRYLDRTMANLRARWGAERGPVSRLFKREHKIKPWRRLNIDPSGDYKAFHRLLITAPFAHMKVEGAPEVPPNAKRGQT